VSGTAVERVAAGRRRYLKAVADRYVVVLSAIENIIAGAADQLIIAISSIEGIIARRRRYRLSFITPKRVVPAYGCCTIAAVQSVISAPAANEVIAIKASQVVRMRAAYQAVGT
jgi:hypothetical protein